VFPWGDAFDGTRLNYCDAACELNWADESLDDGYARTAPVGSYPEGASWCEALDTAGNVGEWAADWYGEYASAQQENPTGPASGEDRVVRGGSWHYNWNHMRTAARLEVIPGAHGGDLGFRCAVSPSE
jgi:formylglycine-generating enzyme required for sulfatase activity